MRMTAPPAGTKTDAAAIRTVRTRALMAGMVACLLGLSMPAPAADLPFLPQFAGAYAAGGGANATFAQIDSSWHGSQVLWNESDESYGTGSAIGSYAWGTGLWGLADWRTAQHALQAPGDVGAPPIIRSWVGLAPTVNFSNALYNTDYAGTWGLAELAPIFGATDSASAQENWTVHLQGYIRIVEAGAYNFSVLNDDGFFLSLTGAGGSTVAIGRDFLNARDRTGFSDNLVLAPGLYGLELGMWNRLEAGVVDLRWQTPGSSDWSLVPTTHLLSISAVPEPAGAALFLAGLGALAVWRQRSAESRGRRA